MQNISQKSREIKFISKRFIKLSIQDYKSQLSLPFSKYIFPEEGKWSNLAFIFNENPPKMYNTISDISTVITQCYKWSRICQQSQCWQHRHKWPRVSLTGSVQTAPRLLSCTDHQTSQMSPWLTRSFWAKSTCPHRAYAWNHTAPCPWPQCCFMGFLHINISVTPPSECLLLSHPCAVSKLCGQLQRLVLITTILFPFLHWLFKNNLLKKNYVHKHGVRYQLNKTNVVPDHKALTTKNRDIK